jgi:shikimate dehydrogenase
MRKYLSKKRSNNADINVGLIGSGIQESRSPLMHMREAEAQKFSLNYDLFDLDNFDINSINLEDLLDEIENAGYTGVNVTHPCKQTIIKYLDEVETEASDLGAVNTIIFKKGKRYGHNTDWQGFYASLKISLPDIQKESVLQLGAGGAGSAVAYALAKTGIKTIYIYDVDTDKTKVLIKRLTNRFKDIAFIIPDNIEFVAQNCEGIINATPIGMKKYPGLPLPSEYLSPNHWLADVIYFPLETELLKVARKLGCNTLDGSGMAIHQACEAFKLFTKKQANVDRMAQTFFNEFS